MNNLSCKRMKISPSCNESHLLLKFNFYTGSFYQTLEDTTSTLFLLALLLHTASTVHAITEKRYLLYVCACKYWQLAFHANKYQVQNIANTVGTIMYAFTNKGKGSVFYTNVSLMFAKCYLNSQKVISIHCFNYIFMCNKI